MSIRDLNTYSVGLMLKYVSETNVNKYLQAFPEQEESVTSYWRSKRKIDIDQLVLHNTDTLCQNLELCQNLKVFRITERRIGLNWNDVLTVIGKHCQDIEVLDIKGIVLSNIHLRALRTLTSLKSLVVNVNCTDRALGQLFQNNVSLESVSIYDYKHMLRGPCLKQLPSSITKIELFHLYMDPQMFFGCLKNWKLKVLHFDYPLTKVQEELSQLTTCRHLQSLNICCDSLYNEYIHILQQIFQNNPELVDVRLIAYGLKRSVPSFGPFPHTLKNLYITGDICYWHDSLINNMGTIDLESFFIRNVKPNMVIGTDPNYVTKLVRVAPNLRHLTLNLWETIPLHPLAELKKLQSLRLFSDTKIDTILELICNNCNELEELTIENTELSVEGFKNIPKLSKLKKLELLHINLHFDSECIRFMAECHTLENFRIHHCSYFSNVEAILLLDTCKNIKSLTIFKCKITIKLIREMLRVLRTQKQRKNILKLAIEDCFIPKKTATKKGLQHPLFQVIRFYKAEFVNRY